MAAWISNLPMQIGTRSIVFVVNDPPTRPPRAPLQGAISPPYFFVSDDWKLAMEFCSTQRVGEDWLGGGVAWRWWNGGYVQVQAGVFRLPRYVGGWLLGVPMNY